MVKYYVLTLNNVNGIGQIEAKLPVNGPRTTWMRKMGCSVVAWSALRFELHTSSDVILMGRAICIVI